MPKPERAKAVRVEIEYEDGVVTTLTGDRAQEYISIVDDQAVQAWSRGARMPPLPWKRVNIRCKKCGGVGEHPRLEILGTWPNMAPCECTKAST